MSNSRLPTYVRLSPNVTKPRQGTIKGVAIHCTAGGKDLPAERFADMGRFIKHDPKNGASCHYVVGGDGSIAQVCGEENRAWCTSNKIDHQLVTIEVFNESGRRMMVLNQRELEGEKLTPFQFSAKDFTSGSYTIKIVGEAFKTEQSFYVLN